MMISVIIPAKKASPDLEELLESLRKQTKKPGEIIVVFDKKAGKSSTISKKYHVRQIFDQNETIGGAYATGADAAKGDILAFTDDDCIAPPNWLSQIERGFEKGIEVIGGEDLLPSNSGIFQKAAFQLDKARIMKKTVYGREAEKRLRAANIAYKKEIFRMQNFDKNLKGLQEPEFHHRLFKNGVGMKFDPKIYVYHKRRQTLSGIFRQIYRNGKAKIDLIKIHRDLLGFIDVFPFIFIAFSIAMAFMAIHYSQWLFFQAWLGVTLLYFLSKPLWILSKTNGFRYYPYLFFIILARETAYSLGILAGIKNIFKH